MPRTRTTGSSATSSYASRTTAGICDFRLDHSLPRSAIALDLLRVGAPVSIGFHSLEHDRLLAEDGVKRHTRARLDELSILAPDEIPAYRGAKITSIHELKPTAQASRATARNQDPDGEAIDSPPGRVLIRPGIGQILGVR